MARRKPASQPNLWNVPERAPKPKKAPVLDHAIFGIYKSLYEARYHELPHVTDAHGALLRRLATQFGLDKVKARLEFFLRWDDPYVIEQGHTIDVFYRQWNRITALLQKRETERKSAVPSAAETQAYLQRLREKK